MLRAGRSTRVTTSVSLGRKNASTVGNSVRPPAVICPWQTAGLMPNPATLMESAGAAPVATYFLSTRVDDLAALRTAPKSEASSPRPRCWCWC
jgi:hypothetical protein